MVGWQMHIRTLVVLMAGAGFRHRRSRLVTSIRRPVFASGKKKCGTTLWALTIGLVYFAVGSNPGVPQACFAQDVTTSHEYLSELAKLKNDERDPQVSNLLVKAADNTLTIARDSTRADYLADVAAAMAESGHREIASILFASAAELAATDSVREVAPSLLKMIAVRAADVGMFQQSESIIALLKPSGKYEPTFYIELESYYRSLAYNHARNGEIEKARSIALASPIGTDRISRKCSVARGQFESRDKLGAIATLKEATEGVSELMECHDREWALYKIGTAYIDIGCQHEAKLVLDEARYAITSDLEEVVYSSWLIADGFARLGDTLTVREIISEQKQAANALNRRALFKILSKGNFRDAAQLGYKGVIGEDDTSMSWRLALSYAAAGEYDKSKKVADKLPHFADSYKVAIMMICWEMVSRGDLNDAYLLSSHASDLTRVRLLATIADDYAKKGDSANANKVRIEAKALAHQIILGGDEWTEYHVLRFLAESFAKAGQAEEMLAFGEEVKPPTAKVSILLGVVKGLREMRASNRSN